MTDDATSLPPTTGSPDALDARLVVVKQEPFNAETPLGAQIGLLTPAPLFYVRTNFGVPQVDAQEWRLTIGGEVERAMSLSYDELRALPSRSLLVTLECAGNGRSAMQPQAEGEAWQYGAVSTAEWTGVPLRDVLAAAGLRPDAREIVIEGADRGTVALREGVIPFARGLALETALAPDTLLAYAMNGEPLSAEHGFPLRLLVPGWYGMASVKWVTRIEASAGRFDGYYQVDRYILDTPSRSGAAPEPVTSMRVRSLILHPAEGATLPRGEHRLRGLAWSGAAPVARVEVSTDAGATWQEAEWVSDPARYAWRRWEYPWQATTPGSATLQSRAYDEAGNGQPTAIEWNRLGYANNAIQVVRVTVK